jgi:HEPN domain-containing protein
MTPDYDVTTFETWRLKAEEDFSAASILAEHGGPAATICFLWPAVSIISVDDAVFLKRYYLESRYPDDLPQDVRPEEVAAALTATSHLRDFVLAKAQIL